MHSSFRAGPLAMLLLLGWTPPARAAALFAQAEGSSTLEYVVAALATGVVLLVVCWPAKRGE